MDEIRAATIVTQEKTWAYVTLTKPDVTFRLTITLER
jgi:hypothetical protein